MDKFILEPRSPVLLSIKGRVRASGMHIVGASGSAREKEGEPEKGNFRQSSDQFLLTLPIFSRGLLRAFSAAAVVAVMLN